MLTRGQIDDCQLEIDKVAWVPVDLLSKIIVELVERDSKVKGRAWTNCYHLANPKGVDMGDACAGHLEVLFISGVCQRQSQQ
jgi:hypothetical protein